MGKQGTHTREKNVAAYEGSGFFYAPGGGEHFKKARYLFPMPDPILTL